MSLADYHRIERAIRFLDGHFLEQPKLAEAARAAGLSEFHFQRLFCRWAGISPKRFLQFLTAGYARLLLEASHSTLQTACEAGLSSVSRLHDLTVRVYAATPGELKQRGAGLQIDYGCHPTPFGDCLIALSHRGVCWMSFPGSGETDPVDQLHQCWPHARFQESRARTRPVVNRIFDSRGPLDLHLHGTNFQIRVWEALLRIPSGAVTSYERLAGEINASSAVRAVANAVAANRVAFLIPCHRVIRKTGAFGGYRWDPARKSAMLLWESARTGRLSTLPPA